MHLHKISKRKVCSTMKSIRIVTFCTCSSIGSILQSFALKKALLNKGYESKLLLECEKEKKINIFKPKHLIREFFQIYLNKKITLANQKRKNFISEYIDVIYYEDYSELIDISAKDNADCYLAGSDQIWNPGWCPPVFFLDFIKDKRRVSYAASMGNTVFSDEKKMDFIRMIKNFNRISVRESECSDIIKALTGMNSEVHIDPTFLIEADEWRKYESAYGIDEPYILLYMLYWDDALTHKVKELQKRTGLKVHTIKNGLSGAYGDKILYDVGVEEFLWLVDHAEYVVTSSFHGVAMSTIFNKKFAAVVNPASPSRIENLLKVLSIPHVDINDLDSADNFDYTVINQKILEERERGIKYLQEALK